jgi:hypothetical protein
MRSFCKDILYKSEKSCKKTNLENEKATHIAILNVFLQKFGEVFRRIFETIPKLF